MTKLRCVTCGRYICPDCMVDAPVGYKCRECASSKTTHVEMISAKQYLIAGIVGIIIGAGTGFIWFYLSRYGALVSMLVAYAVGFCISRAITASIGNKVGLKIKIFAALITVISIIYNPIVLIGYFYQWGTASFFGLLYAMTLMCSHCIIKLLALVIAVWAAIRHFRF